jgi:hypothetical protein
VPRSAKNERHAAGTILLLISTVHSRSSGPESPNYDEQASQASA